MPRIDPSLKEEIEELNRRLESSPDDVGTLVHLGALMFEPCHQPKKAQEYLKRALAEDPKNADAWFWLAKCLFHDYVDLEGARDALERALESEPKRADCLGLLSSVLMDIGVDVQEYIQYLQQAVRSAPDWPILRQQYAQALMKLGRLNEAEQQVQQGLALTNSPPAPAGERDEYYETAVTGRIWPYTQDELNALLKEIRHRKTCKR